MSTQFLTLFVSHNVTTPYEAWTVLLGHFERSSLPNKMDLKCQLFGFKMQPGQTMQCHLKELKEIIQRSAVLDAPVDEEDQVAVLLCSLPPSYDCLVTFYVAKDEVTMGELQEALIKYECLLNGEEESGTFNVSSADGEASTGSIQIIHCPTDPCEKGQSLGGDGADMLEYVVDSDINEILTVDREKSKSDNRQWVIKSCATLHTIEHDILYDCHVLSVPKSSNVDGTVCTCFCIGKSVVYACLCGSNVVLYVLDDVMCVPILSQLYDVTGSRRLACAVKNLIKIVNLIMVLCALFNDDASEEEDALPEVMECKRSGSTGRRAPFLEEDRFGVG